MLSSSLGGVSWTGGGLALDTLGLGLEGVILNVRSDTYGTATAIKCSWVSLLYYSYDTFRNS